MNYSCIQCSAESGSPMCSKCRDKKMRDAREARRSQMRTALSNIGVPRGFETTPPDDDGFRQQGNLLVVGEARNLYAAQEAHDYLWWCAGWRRPDDDHWWGDIRFTDTSRAMDDARSSSKASSWDDLTTARFLDLAKVPVICLTDLGDESVTEWSASKLLQILKHRTEDGKRTVVTTRHQPDYLRMLYGDSVGPALLDILASYTRIKT